MGLTDADRAYQQIKDMIITLEMPPGTVIQEAQLGETLGLGRTPIREALKRLEAESLVIVKPRRGIFVADISITHLLQIFEVRLELESLCARLAAQRMTPEQLQILTALADEYRRADRSNLRLLFDIDCRFHQTLAEAARNQFLAREMEKYHNLALRIWYLSLDRIKADDVNVDAHLDILAAIQNQDAEGAAQRMREHIEHFHTTVKQYF